MLRLLVNYFGQNKCAVQLIKKNSKTKSFEEEGIYLSDNFLKYLVP